MRQVKLLLFSVLIFVCNGVSAQQQEKAIQLVVKYHDKVVVDTVLKKSGVQARLIIESVVGQYSTQSVYIDSEVAHGLYVFNIADAHWKGQRKYTETWFANEFKQLKIDSLFNEFSNELNSNWHEISVEMIIDSISEGLHQLKKKADDIDIHSNPTFNDLQKDLKEFMKRVGSTQVIIVHEGDTLDID